MAWSSVVPERGAPTMKNRPVADVDDEPEGRGASLKALSARLIDDFDSWSATQWVLRFLVRVADRLMTDRYTRTVALAAVLRHTPHYCRRLDGCPRTNRRRKTGVGEFQRIDYTEQESSGRRR